MNRFKVIPFLCLLIALTGSAVAQTGSNHTVPEAWTDVSENGPWVVRINFDNRQVAKALSQRLDVWRIDPFENYLEAAIDADEMQQLFVQGFQLELDEAKTQTLSHLGIPLPNQGSGIPGFPCYRTVEETYDSAAALAAANPDLATWSDIGDSWEKTQDSNAGFDIMVLKLTQSAVSGPKPVFFATFAIHAREYTTAELGTRFAELLVNGYGVDPDITWLLDAHEVHLVLQANPDGRKQAETGLFWRKNSNNNYCSNTNSRGADLNRNFDFQWGCCGGSSGSQCDATYRGAAAGSEPEIQTIQNYFTSIFPDQRGPDPSDPAPSDATGVAIDIHSFGNLLLYPWGFTTSPTPNDIALTTMARKLGFFNGSTPLQIQELTIADGSSADYYYGELGVAGFGYELGTQFFEPCANFEQNILQVNLDSLLYAAKAARTPYLSPAGPEATNVAVPAPAVAAGASVLLSATVDDTLFNNSNGTEPTQTIAAAEAFVDTPPWDDSAVPLSMVASDGTFDEGVEGVEVLIDTTGLSSGRHTLYVRGIDSDGNEGVVGAVFLTIDLGEIIFTDGFESGDASAWSMQIP